MMGLISASADRLGRAWRFLWSAWAGIAGLALFAGLWQAGHETYGAFILPSPLDTMAAAGMIVADPISWSIIATTMLRAAEGFALSVAVGIITGSVAGYSPAAMRIARPLLTVLLGVPPIAWIVFAMIWFGSTDNMVATVVTVSATPIIFAGVAEGIMTRDRGLDDMARLFGASACARLWTLGARQAAAFLFPALGVALGVACKVTVMAELLANTGGMGGELALARANLDVAGAMAWVLIAVAVLITAEYALLHPFRAEIERWRDAARPWGVKR